MLVAVAGRGACLPSLPLPDDPSPGKEVILLLLFLLLSSILPSVPPVPVSRLKPHQMELLTLHHSFSRRSERSQRVAFDGGSWTRVQGGRRIVTIVALKSASSQFLCYNVPYNGVPAKLNPASWTTAHLEERKLVGCFLSSLSVQSHLWIVLTELADDMPV